MTQEELKQRLIKLLMQKGFGVEGATIAADHLIANGVTIRERGKWISCKNNAGCKCSICGSRIKNSEKINGNHIYCHKCGADMRGVKDECL